MQPDNAAAGELQDGSEVIPGSDVFESIHVKVNVRNATTRTEPIDPEIIRIGEIHESGMLLHLPQRSCACGHSMVISVHLVTPQGLTMDLSMTARVEEIEATHESNEEFVRILFIQYNQEDWERFCEAFTSRQNEIDTFLRAARGY